jgi:hypothetical protein
MNDNRVLLDDELFFKSNATSSVDASKYTTIPLIEPNRQAGILLSNSDLGKGVKQFIGKPIVDLSSGKPLPDGIYSTATYCKLMVKDGVVQHVTQTFSLGCVPLFIIFALITVISFIVLFVF